MEGPDFIDSNVKTKIASYKEFKELIESGISTFKSFH